MQLSLLYALLFCHCYSFFIISSHSIEISLAIRDSNFIYGTISFNQQYQPGKELVKNPPTSQVRKIPWRRKWQLTPVFLSGKFHGQRSLTVYCPWDCKELDTTQHLNNNSELQKGVQSHLYLCPNASPTALYFCNCGKVIKKSVNIFFFFPGKIDLSEIHFQDAIEVIWFS